MQKIIKYCNTIISYTLTGNGKTVLLLHGFAEDATIWKSLVWQLNKKYKVICIDLPGTGESDWIKDITIDTCAQIIAAILQREQITLCTLLGHSMGGYIALAFAKKYPDRLRGIGLLHSTAYADTEEKKAARRKSIDFIKEYSAIRYLLQSIPNLFASNFVTKNKMLVAAHIQRNTYMNKETLIGYSQAMLERPDSIAFLQQTTLPILFIIGAKDNAVPYENSLAQCYLPKISYIHILNELGHMGMLEHPIDFNHYVVNFLKEIN
jgi:pimeloyl-ACP methyl ester carboxylesterase